MAVNLLPLPACWSFWQELIIPAIVKSDKNDTTIFFIFLAIKSSENSVIVIVVAVLDLLVAVAARRVVG